MLVSLVKLHDVPVSALSMRKNEDERVWMALACGATVKCVSRVIPSIFGVLQRSRGKWSTMGRREQWDPLNNFYLREISNVLSVKFRSSVGAATRIAAKGCVAVCSE